MVTGSIPTIALIPGVKPSTETTTGSKAVWLRAVASLRPQRLKTVIVESDYDWSEAETEWINLRTSENHPNHGWNELVFYEVHPKGFTMNPARSGQPRYLQRLGTCLIYRISVSQPLNFFPSAKATDGGYNNLNFFGRKIPAEFLQTGRVDDVLDEFKWMVDQFHQHDIEVIIDVVYNHG